MTKVELPEKMITLEQCSMNDKGEPVTHLQNKVYCFDDISEMEGIKYRKKKKLYSADGLYIGQQGEIFFFEFKNAPHNHIPKNSVFQKMHDSIITWQICQNSDKGLDDLMQKSTYFVIYNDSRYKGQRENESASMDKMKERMKKMAKIDSEEPILWGTDIFLNSFYKEIHTVDVDVFEKKYVARIFGKELYYETKFRGNPV